MEFGEYQELAKRTVNSDLSLRLHRANFALGLSESGELQDVVKKHLFHGHCYDETRKKIIDEAGDVLWYLAGLCDAYDVGLDAVASYNIEKLKKRYPDGFSEDASRNRVE